LARILVGVSGGIACYKAVELVRLATTRGHAVRVVQTPEAQRFVGRATFEAITGAPALCDQFELDPTGGVFPGDPQPSQGGISHLQLVLNCDVYVIAPATANTIAKLAGGLSDNLVTACALASTKPVVIAPAMNNHMFENPATQANIATLTVRATRIVYPETGPLASAGEWGAGRLAEPETILERVEKAVSNQSDGPLSGLKVVVTAGGTREPIDTVRYVGNRSSGRMGLAIARQALLGGANVVAVCANVSLARPAGIYYLDVSTAEELKSATEQAFGDADILMMAAAVSDFRPIAANDSKLRRRSENLTLTLESTADIVAELSSKRRPDQVVVAFAAEDGRNTQACAQQKLYEKGCDAVVVNDVSRSDIGFDAEQNEVSIVTPSQVKNIAQAPKAEVARAILDNVAELVKSKRSPNGYEVMG
jgi:phosphopantothenoylcysteine decarboxylase / phosphopantothenate---cysteine ligase